MRSPSDSFRKIRDCLFLKYLQKLSRRPVGTKEYSCPLPLRRCHHFQFPGNKMVLQVAVGKRAAGKNPLLSCTGPEILVDPVPVAADLGYRGLQDSLSAAVIGRQEEHTVLRIVPVQNIISEKVLHHQGIRSPESVDGLIVIPDNKEVVQRRGQKTEHLILARAHILKFVDQNPAKALLP